ADVVREARFQSIVYLSSTRLYRNSATTREDAMISANVSAFDDLYNLTKAAGESLALNVAQNGKVVRLSNVFGPDLRSSNFLASVIRAAVEEGHVTFETALDSAKDYVDIDDVCESLIRIARDGNEAIYNVASGVPVSHREIAAELQRLTQC